MEQAFVTMGTAFVLSQSPLPWDSVRLGVAWAWVFCAARIAFVMGYASTASAASNVWRLPGLLAGGFWANSAALVYVMLVGNNLVAPSTTAAVVCYLGVPSILIVALFGLVGALRNSHATMAADKKTA